MRTFPLICLLSVIPIASSAQYSIPQPSDFRQYRPIGEERIWTVIIRDTVIGTVKSTVDKTDRLEGRSAFILRRTSDLDYTKVGINRKTSVAAELMVSNEGRYLGEKTVLSVADETDTLFLEKRRDTFEGYYTRAGRRVEKSFDVSSDFYGIDDLAFDELEMFLAMRDVAVGIPIEDSIIQPQGMFVNHFKGMVEEFGYQALYQGKADSVFFINVFSPQPMNLYLNNRRQLVKVDIPNLDLKAYLDVVKRDPLKEIRKPSISLRTLLLHTPYYLANLVIAILAFVFLCFRVWQRSVAYLGVIAGVVVFGIIRLIQTPLQNFIVQSVVLPMMQSGSSPWSVGIIPSGSVAVLQTASLFALAWAVSRLTISGKVKPFIIAAAGVGFGLAEACYLDTIMGFRVLFSWGILERTYMIFFYGAGALLIGAAVILKRSAIWPVLIIALGLNALLRFLPLMVQQKIVPVEPLFLVAAFLVLVFVFGVVKWHRRLNI